ncbi:hypothetical protein M0802_013102 [Mischocyttarus mexicanus]|nr:hypothetical protein M0802_013102 [Mischocyttarus mexicanus]
MVGDRIIRVPYPVAAELVCELCPTERVGRLRRDERRDGVFKGVRRHEDLVKHIKVVHRSKTKVIAICRVCRFTGDGVYQRRAVTMLYRKVHGSPPLENAPQRPGPCRVARSTIPAEVRTPHPNTSISAEGPRPRVVLAAAHEGNNTSSAGRVVYRIATPPTTTTMRAPSVATRSTTSVTVTPTQPSRGTVDIPAQAPVTMTTVTTTTTCRGVRVTTSVSPSLAAPSASTMGEPTTTIGIREPSTPDE